MTEFWAVGHLLRRCHQVNTGVWAQVFDDLLTPPQYAVLVATMTEGHLGPLAIGRSVGLDKSTTIEIVRRLERSGWIRRTVASDDRRRQQLELSAPAQLAITSSQPLAGEARRRFLEPLPSRDHDALLGHLRALARVDAPPPARHGAGDHAFETTPGHLVRLALQNHQTHWVDEFTENGPTRPQVAVLRMLHEAGPMTQRRLGALTSLDASTLSAVVTRLQQREQLARRPSPEDKRVKLVQLTPAGEAVATDTAAGVERVQLATLQPIPGPERPWLHEALSQLAFRGAPPPVESTP